MIELNKEEKNKILDLSRDFIRIHGELLSVEESIKKLEAKSLDLIAQLEECRTTDKQFSDQLKEKYGPGRLDVNGLCWKNEETLIYEELR
jgi:hypothetical protein